MARDAGSTNHRASILENEGMKSIASAASTEELEALYNAELPKEFHRKVFELMEDYRRLSTAYDNIVTLCDEHEAAIEELNDGVQQLRDLDVVQSAKIRKLKEAKANLKRDLTQYRETTTPPSEAAAQRHQQSMSLETRFKLSEKAADPEPFSGETHGKQAVVQNHLLFQSWKRMVDQKFILNADRYTSTMARQAYVTGRLSGLAAQFAETWLSQNPELSDVELMEKLGEIYRDPQAKMTSQDKPATQEGLDKLKDLIRDTKADLEDHLSNVEERLQSADTNLRAALQEEQARLQSNIETILQSQRAVNAAGPRINVDRNIGAAGSRTVFGTSFQNPNMDLSVCDNKAGVGATMAAGVLSEAVFLKALDGAQTPNIALVRQMMQSPSSFSNPSSVENMMSQLSMQSDGERSTLPSWSRALPSSLQRLPQGFQ